MPFQFDHQDLCPRCPFGLCIEDRRLKPIRGRNTQFRLKQNTAMQCTFGEFMPGTDSDPDPGRSFSEYITQFRNNATAAGTLHFGDAFSISAGALAKVEGDVFELMEAGALWNAFAVWNRFMDTGQWESPVFQQPKDAVPTSTRKVAALSLPRGYDTTRLFREDIRNNILAHENALKRREMELGLSAPDIVGIRLPDPITPEFEPFLDPLPNLGEDSRSRLESIYQSIEGTLEGRSFLFALAIKRTTRSDRLYQPLFEANILKYLIEVVLRGAAFRFYVHMGSLEGADVEGHYRAASLISLMQGGEPNRAVDALLEVVSPAHAAQAILDDLPLFPL